MTKTACISFMYTFFSFEFTKKQNKYEQIEILIMQMHCQDKKYNFQNYMKNSYKSQKHKSSNRPSNLQTIYKRKREL